jgi:F-type H+-transporting ATPase subunit delta
MAAVSSRYARALADAVTGGKLATLLSPEQVEDQLQGFLGLMQESADLRNVLTSPAVKAKQKKALVETLGGKLDFSIVARNFLFILVDHKRIALLHEILPLFRVEIDQRQGIVQADVASAAPLGPEDRAKLEAALAQRTGKKVRAAYRVDSTLIGGVVTRVGSTVYDGSVREQLKILRAKLSSQ